MFLEHYILCDRPLCHTMWLWECSQDTLEYKVYFLYKKNLLQKQIIMYVTWESCRKPYKLTQAYAYIKLTIHWNTTPSYTPWMKVQPTSSFILWVLLSSVNIITSTLGTMVTPSLPVVNIQCLRYKCHALCRFCVILMILKNWTVKTKNRKYQVYNDIFHMFGGLPVT